MTTNPTSQQLQGLASALPIANQQTQKQLDAARQIQLQQTLGQTPTSGVSRINPIAQQIGVQATQQQAQQNLAAKQTAQNQQTQLGQMALQAKGTENQGNLAQQQSQASDEGFQLGQQLSRLDMRLKNELLDKQLEFRTSQAGQALLNESQLQDFAILKAKDDIELNKYQQLASEATQKKMYMLQVANDKLKQVLNQGYLREGQELTQAMKRDITAQQVALEQKIQRERNAAANRQSMWQVGGMIVGGAIGAVAGGPAGAMAGASVGGGLGSVAGSKLG
jgi:hypothetical protein